MHCDNPPCVKACPTRATYKSNDGSVVIDEDRCIGCGGCIEACPYNARFRNPVTGTADKCDYCRKSTPGQEPACVQVCPVHCRIFGDADNPNDPVAHVAVVFGENAKANPWGQTYAEEQGFKPTDSVITVFNAYPGNANVDHNSTTGPALLETLGSGISGAASGIGACYAEYGKEKSDRFNQITFAFLMLCPEHAATIQKDFPKKADAKKYLQAHTVKPYKYYTAGPLGCEPPKDVTNFNADTLMPRFMHHGNRCV